MYSLHSFNTLKKTSSYHFYTIWLFTRSDIKTIIFPSLAFALINSISFTLASDSNSSINQPLTRTPLVLLWVWINLLAFNVDNQRRPDSIREDQLNKPWRPIACNRISPESAGQLLYFLYPAATMISLSLGTLIPCLSLIILGHCYSALGGADANWAIRNLINVGGIQSFSLGALQVAIDSNVSAIHQLGWWTLVIAGIIFTTVHTQDMPDQEGDAVRGRKTLPLVIGDGAARWTVAVPMVGWAFFAPWVVGCDVKIAVVSIGMGLMVAGRTLGMRSVREDEGTWRLWNIWLVSVYFLPLLKHVVVACEIVA